MKINADAKVVAASQATAAIARMFGGANTKYKTPTLAVADDLPKKGVLYYAARANSYYFDRDAHRSFFFQSYETGESIPVRLHLCADALVIRRLPADGNWH
jgi:hypothetical protein